MKKVLFVDDDTNILDGFRRSLRDMRKEWDLYFTPSGKEALELIANHDIDAVVSDMRMPEIDGAQLLGEAMKISPFTARFVLSGQSDKESILRTVGPAHQYFAKPCEMDQIKDVITHALNLRSKLLNHEVTGVISQIESLPSLPQIYTRIVTELQEKEPDIGKITALIESDLGFSTKILQVVNSSFFGIPNHISSIRQGVSFLGLEVLKALVLCVKVFHEFKSSVVTTERLDDLMTHSLETARYAKILMETMPFGKEELEAVFTAACFHDVGKLIFYAYWPEKANEVERRVKEQSCPESEAEKQVIGVTHAEVGAYLLCLWGLKDVIVELILNHHTPALYRQPSPLMALLHVADYLHHEHCPGLIPLSGIPLDLDYLQANGLADRLDGWRELIAKKTGGK